MKTFTISTVIALATVASAQLSNIPSCALSCFIPALSSDGCADLTDFACHCKQGAKLLGTVQPCVQGACSAADQATTISAVEKTCQDAGEPIEIPDTSAGASSAVASATSAAASAASSAVESATSEAAEVTSSAAEAASSALSSLASAITSAANATHTAAGNGTATASSSVSQFTGGAAQATQAAGLLGAAALALLAL